MNNCSYNQMLKAVKAFHEKHDLRKHGGEELVYRIALMAEELGEISSCVTKGKNKELLAEECADLLILLIGTAISADIALDRSFWEKMTRLEKRSGRIIDGRIRVSEFKGV
tara:strand:- start:419 stop:751 length:333 start_codon:yes stop_codon:yes gene_type:complete